MGQLRLRKEIAASPRPQVEVGSQIPAHIQRRPPSLFKLHQVALRFMVLQCTVEIPETGVQRHLGNVVPFDTEQSKEVQVGSESKQANDPHRA